jgi:hypothetical protein
VFFAAFKIAPCGGKFAKLASELDRLGVSEARARGNTAWVKATYDPFGVTYTSPVLLMGEGQAWKDDTETALATALNVSYVATQLSLFSLVVGIALLLAGIGFIVLAASGVLRKQEA